VKFVEYKEGETDACIRFETPEEVLILLCSTIQPRVE
jgi:hypothetical protein